MPFLYWQDNLGFTKKFGKENWFGQTNSTNFMLMGPFLYNHIETQKISCVPLLLPGVRPVSNLFRNNSRVLLVLTLIHIGKHTFYNKYEILSNLFIFSYLKIDRGLNEHQTKRQWFIVVWKLSFPLNFMLCHNSGN